MFLRSTKGLSPAQILIQMADDGVLGSARTSPAGSPESSGESDSKENTGRWRKWLGK